MLWEILKGVVCIFSIIAGLIMLIEWVGNWAAEQFDIDLED